MSSNLSHEQLAARYDLLCRAVLPTPPADDPHPVAAELDGLQALINHDLLELARGGSPDHFAELYLEFGRELERLREFCAYPALAQKVVVAFGGAFSAGKSSLINALLDLRLLVAEVDPTTSLPTYLLHGDTDAIYALNLHHHRIRLSLDEFRSLTHEEMRDYGCAVGGLLQAAFITRADFPWPNLALIDTPGYSKPEQASHSARTDEHLARAQLNAAQAVVWVVSVKAGCITEDDLNFLATLNPAIPRLVVVSRADSLPEDDIRAIVADVRRALASRGLPALDVVPVSNRKKPEYPLAPVRAYLRAWSLQSRPLRFTHNFKALFTRYARSIAAEQRRARWYLHRLNRMSVLADNADDMLADVGELKAETDDRIRQLHTQAQALAALSRQFFATLAQVGDTVGIPLPEPDDMELLEAGAGNVLEVLSEARRQRGGKEPDYRQTLRPLRQPGNCAHQPRLLRHHAAQLQQALAPLQTHDAAVAHLRQLLRQPVQRLVDALAPLARTA